MPTPTRKPDGALRPALEHLVKGIVDHPDDVRVRMIDARRGQRLEVRVHPEDLGTVIGRGGRTAKALRQVITLDRRAGRPGRHRRRVLIRSMQLVVGRILRPHGVRGEVVVEVRTDEPGRAFRRRVGAGHRPGGGRPADASRRVRPHQGRLLVDLRRVSPTGHAPTTLRGVLLLRRQSADVRRPTDPDEFHDLQLVGLAVVEPPAASGSAR